MSGTTTRPRDRSLGYALFLCFFFFYGLGIRYPAAPLSLYHTTQSLTSRVLWRHHRPCVAPPSPPPIIPANTEWLG